MSDQPLTGNEDSDIDSGLKMIGIVRSIRLVEQTDEVTGITTHRIQITGEDFHSVFNTPIYLNVNLSDVAKGKDVSIASAILSLDVKFGSAPLAPDTMVKTIVDSLLGNPEFEGDKSGKAVSRLAFISRGGQPFLVPKPIAQRILGTRDQGAPGNLFTGLLTFFLQKKLLGKTSLQSDIGNMVTAWSMIQAYCHRLLNEVYTDLLPVNINGKTRLIPSMVLRAIPFSSKQGKTLHGSLSTMQDATPRPAIARSLNGIAVNQSSTNKNIIPPETGAHFFVSKKISDDQIFYMNAGKSDGERFNFFFIPPNLTGTGTKETNEAAFLSEVLQGTSFTKILDKNSIARYGLRPYIAYSNYLINDFASISKVNNVVRDLWQKAHLYENGQVGIIGSKDHIPVGTNIEFTDRGFVGHVEKVDHNFENLGNGIKKFRTGITFVRLHNKDGTIIDLVEDNIADKLLQAGNKIGSIA